ncbi:MAG: patatin-like phospholipase family protein [Caldilineales bacterium]|nr:patatin-like phospholipase family protein [Caldilineales bacterium]MDW8317816.1 patatin-like phospholipase family protein [Anaerolineae bacterium]
MVARALDSQLSKEVRRWAGRTSHQVEAAAEGLRAGVSSLRTLRRGLLPLPLVDREPTLETDLFAPWRPFTVRCLQGKRVGIVATGGSGAAISALGVMRACQEAGLEIAAISACSGSALFLAPVAAGLSVQEALEFIFSWRQQDYIEPDWSALAKLPLTLGRHFPGLLNAEVVEYLYHRRLDGVVLGDLATPFYTHAWDVENNRVLYLGSRPTPEVRLSRLARLAVTLPGITQPVEIQGSLCCDGAVANPLPVEPLVRYHPEVDFVIGINVLLPPDLRGQELTGWGRLNPLALSRQARRSQRLEAARMQWRLVQNRSLLLHPVDFHESQGIRFYELWVDRGRWPEFVMRGYHHARRNLALLDRRSVPQEA